MIVGRAVSVAPQASFRSDSLPALLPCSGAVRPADGRVRGVVGVGLDPLVPFRSIGSSKSLALGGVDSFHLWVRVDEVVILLLIRRDQESDGGGIRRDRRGRLGRGAPFIGQVVNLFPFPLRQRSRFDTL